MSGMELEGLLESILANLKSKLSVAKIASEYCIDSKRKRKHLQEGIVSYIVDRLDIVRQQQLPHEIVRGQMRELVWSFLRKHSLHTATSYEGVSEAVERFGRAGRGEGRNVLEVVRNVYDPVQEVAACHCAPLPPPDAQTLRCSCCQVESHPLCLWGKDPREPFYDCPLCFLKNCLPNRLTTRVLFVGYLNWHDRYHTENRIYVPLHLVPSEYEVELRCVRLAPAHRYTLTWPEHYAIKLGDKFLKNVKPLAANSAQKHRSEQQLRLDRAHFGSNQDLSCIVLDEKHTKDKTSHMVAVVLVRANHMEEMEQKMEKLSVEQSKERLRGYLGRSGGGDCEVEGLRVGLKCHFFGGTIGVPVRSKFCTSHYEPFDLKGFMLANWTCKQHWQRWRCPICKQPAYSLQVDLYLLALIQQHPQAMQLTFDREGELQNIESSNEEPNKEITPLAQALNDTSNKQSVRLENLSKSAIDVQIQNLTPNLVKLSASNVKCEQTLRKAAVAINHASHRLMNPDPNPQPVIDLQEMLPSSFQEFIEIVDSEQEQRHPKRKRQANHIQISDDEQLDTQRKRVKETHAVPQQDNPFNFIHRRMTEEDGVRRDYQGSAERLPAPVSPRGSRRGAFFRFKGTTPPKGEYKMSEAIRKPLHRCRMVQVQADSGEMDAMWQQRYNFHLGELESERVNLNGRDKLQELSTSDSFIFMGLVNENMRLWKPTTPGN